MKFFGCLKVEKKVQMDPGFCKKARIDLQKPIWTGSRKTIAWMDWQAVIIFLENYIFMNILPSISEIPPKIIFTEVIIRLFP